MSITPDAQYIYFHAPLAFTMMDRLDTSLDLFQLSMTLFESQLYSLNFIFPVGKHRSLIPGEIGCVIPERLHQKELSSKQKEIDDLKRFGTTGMERISLCKYGGFFLYL